MKTAHTSALINGKWQRFPVVQSPGVRVGLTARVAIEVADTTSVLGIGDTFDTVDLSTAPYSQRVERAIALLGVKPEQRSAFEAEFC